MTNSSVPAAGCISQFEIHSAAYRKRPDPPHGGVTGPGLALALLSGAFPAITLSHSRSSLG
jgi:hypothetical protein